MRPDQDSDRLFWVWFTLMALVVFSAMDVVFSAMDGWWLRQLDDRLTAIEHVQPAKAK